MLILLFILQCFCGISLEHKEDVHADFYPLERRGFFFTYILSVVGVLLKVESLDEKMTKFFFPFSRETICLHYESSAKLRSSGLAE